MLKSLLRKLAELLNTDPHSAMANLVVSMAEIIGGNELVVEAKKERLRIDIRQDNKVLFKIVIEGDRETWEKIKRELIKILSG